MRWYRVVASVGFATAALFMLTGPALAGGWAVTTIDDLPEGGFQAGKTYQLGYTIRQHGQTPFDGAKTSITITSPSNGDHHFRGVPDGRPGHYVAEVTFPSDGAWDWEVSQYPFAVQTLGALTVAPPAGAGPGTGAAESISIVATVSAASVAALPLALLLLAGLIAWPLLVLARRRAPRERPPTSISIG